MNDQEDQEGFTCETGTEFVELNYIPVFQHLSSPHQPLPNSIRPHPSHPTASLLNQQLLSSAAQKFMQRHQGTIIFNSFNKRNVKHQTDITFQSNFQSGNLEYVTEISHREYHLYMRADTNTKGHHQWFYFKVRNKQIRKVTLIIKNFIKSSMLYRKGLKPFAKSLKRGDLFYSQIQSPVFFQEHIDEDQNFSYSLKFEYSFAHLNDEVEFCTQPPYTFAKLNNFIRDMPFKTIQIGKSVMGQKINAYLVNQTLNSKALVVVIARQHPGQTVGSWMMEGFINRLKTIPNNISWLIVPMMNIDGVMLGNNRTGLLGYDFNRHWNADQDTVRQHIFPELTGIIRYFKKCRREKNKKVKLFLDLHGHSSESNVFSYGPPLPKLSEYYENSRLFPYLMSKRNENFKLAQCSYEIENSKKNCARSVFHSKLGFPYSYTIQSSFGIYNEKAINQSHILQVGEDLCSTAIQFVHLLTGQKRQDKFEEIINDMKIESEKYIGCEHHYDSESGEQEEKDEQSHQEFENRINSLFKSKSKAMSHKESSHNQSIQHDRSVQLPKNLTPKEKNKAPWNYSQIKYLNSNHYSEPQVSTKARKGRSYHLRTEPLQPQQRIERTSLKPDIKLPNVNKQRMVHGNIITRRSVFMNSLKKVKLQQLESVNLNGNSCTIGKEIVIFNGYKKFEKN